MPIAGTHFCRKSPGAAHPRATTRRGISWEKGSSGLFCQKSRPRLCLIDGVNEWLGKRVRGFWFGLFSWRSFKEVRNVRGVEVREEFAMSEKIASEVISRRRALSLLGLAALSLAVPTVLTVSDAEAQQPAPPPDAQTGTERRQERRTGRLERRLTRREGRRTRREVRRAGRSERRELRREDR